MISSKSGESFILFNYLINRYLLSTNYVSYCLRFLRYISSQINESVPCGAYVLMVDGGVSNTTPGFVVGSNKQTNLLPSSPETVGWDDLTLIFCTRSKLVLETPFQFILLRRWVEDFWNHLFIGKFWYCRKSNYLGTDPKLERSRWKTFLSK